MAASYEVLERKKESNKVYAKKRWEKIKAEKAEAAEKARRGIESIKAPTLKPTEKQRMDKIVVEAYLAALRKGKTDDAEMIRNNPLNAGIDWDAIIPEEFIYA